MENAIGLQEKNDRNFVTENSDHNIDPRVVLYSITGANHTTTEFTTSKLAFLLSTRKRIF
jgi:hypothetical protein